METLLTFMNISGIGLSLAGALILVREVRYAHLVEYHSLNLDEISRKAAEFKKDPALYIKKSTYAMFGEHVVHAFGGIPEEQWKNADPEDVRRLEEKFAEAVAHAKEWKRRVPARALRLRMRWLTIGAIVLSGGALLQAIVALVRA